MTGGTVLVHGPTARDNGAIDYDYTFQQNGGMLIAAASKGMAQAPSASSTQNSVVVNLTSTASANTIFRITSQNGTEMFTFSPAKEYQSVIFSLPELTKGATYRIYSGGSSTGSVSNGLYSGGTYTPGQLLGTFTITNTITTVN